MDQQLKQRLIGVTIAVALVVIFVPMLFEKSEDTGRLSTSGIPTIPDDVLEKPLELPKTAEELAPEDKKAEKAPVDTGYRIVPLNDEAPPKPDAAEKPSQAEDGDEPDSPMEEADEEMPPPTKDAGVRPSETAKPPVKPEAPAVKHLAEPKQAEAPKAPKAPPAAKHQDAGDAAASAKAQTPSPKPKPAVAQPSAHPAADASAKKPEKPTSVPPTVKVDKPKPTARPAGTDAADTPKKVEAETHPAASNAHVAKPAADKSTTAKPAVPAASAAKAPVKAPTAWVVQTGSFTEESSARNLAEKLKQSKFPAYVETVHGARGTIYRVQVGPEQNRGRAEETLKQIGGSFGINGFLSPRH